MFNLILTVLIDAVSYLRFTRVLEFAAITVVLMLFSSPGTVFGTVGVGAKLGILSFIFKKDEGEEEAS